MKAKLYKPTGKYRIIIPARLTGTGKRERRFFRSKIEAEAEIRRILAGGNSAPVKVSGPEETALALARKEGFSAEEFLDAVRLYKKQVKDVAKKATLEEACVAFIQRQEHERRNIRTIYSDRQALRRLCLALNGGIPMSEVTPAAIQEYINSFPPGGTRLTHYARVKKFLSWAFREGYIKIDIMAGSKPNDKWNANKEKIEVEEFRRILFVIAGLEPIKLSESPTDRYRRLLPFYVLGGLAGMRRCEIISSYPSDPVIQWTDIYWNRNLIVVRDEVAKQTSATDHLRYIPLEPAATDWLRLVARSSGQIMEISQSTLQRLNDELLNALEIDVPPNALRNSYASYALSIRSPGDVAKAMGDTEVTMKRWYSETLEPGDGHAWFGVRPDMAKKILQMSGA